MAEYPDVEIITQPAMQWEASNAGSIVLGPDAGQPGHRPDLRPRRPPGRGRGRRRSKSAGKKPGDVMLVSSNGAPVGLDLIRQGWEQVEVEQPLYAQAAALAMFADKVVNGEEIEPGTYDVLGLQSELTIEDWGPTIKIPGAAITADNVDDPRFWGNLQGAGRPDRAGRVTARPDTGRAAPLARPGRHRHKSPADVPSAPRHHRVPARQPRLADADRRPGRLLADRPALLPVRHLRQHLRAVDLRRRHGDRAGHRHHLRQPRPVGGIDRRAERDGHGAAVRLQRHRPRDRAAARHG